MLNLTIHLLFFHIETILASMVSSLVEVCFAMRMSGDIHVILSVA